MNPLSFSPKGGNDKPHLPPWRKAGKGVYSKKEMNPLLD